MVYVALLRGINVGGKRKVAMADLKAVFEEAGMRDVATYINSGNVVFSSTRRGRKALARRLEEAIEGRFGFEVKVLLRSHAEVRALVDAVPKSWTHGPQTRCEVLFLWDDADRPEVVDEVPAKAGIDEVTYVPGAVVWRVPRVHLTKSRLNRLVGSALYKQMTMRSLGTTQKLLGLMEARDT